MKDSSKDMRRFVAWTVAILAILAGGFIALAIAAFDFLRGDESDGPSISTLARVSVTGPEETVLDWSEDACSAYDFADLPARAYRDARGRVHLVVSHFENRRMSGPSLGGLEHSCQVVMRSGNDSDPARFNDREWIAAPYTSDGRMVYALVHHEYQGNRHAGRCPSDAYFKCWYNAITSARSFDGGRSFRQPTPPGHLVATSPYRYVPDEGPYGVFSPSNIVRNGKDGRYYAFLVAEDHGAQERGSCLIRTGRLSYPSEWRAWDGSSFGTRFVDPYRTRSTRPSDHVCEPVSPNQIASMSSSVTWNTHFNRWLLVGTAGDKSRNGRVTWGIFYSLSDDLIHWEHRRLIREVEFPWTYRCGDRNPVLYPSLLDHDSTSRNFETTGKRPWLYFTRLHYMQCKMSLDRDLVRVPIEFH